jgi:hypothetical protein
MDVPQRVGVGVQAEVVEGLTGRISTHETQAVLERACVARWVREVVVASLPRPASPRDVSYLSHYANDGGIWRI